jgi:O-antigen ligase
VLTLRAGGQITASDVFFGLSFLFASMELTFRRWAVPIQLSPTFLFGVGLFSLGGVLSTFEAVEPLKSLAVIARLIILTFLWFWLGTLLMSRLGHVLTAMKLWVLTAALCGAAGVLQVVAGDVIPGSTMFYGRATGLTVHPNDLGGITSIAFVPALVLASLRGTSFTRRTLSYVFVFLVAGGLVLSGSVGALFAAIVGTFVWFTFQRVSVPSVLVVSIVGLSVLGVIGVQAMRGAPTPLERLHTVTADSTTSGAGSLGDRISTYRVAIREIKKDPFVGVGLDLVRIKRPSGLGRYAKNLHNLINRNSNNH